jgi:flavin reductase
MSAVERISVPGPSSRDYRDVIGLFATGVTVMTVRAGDLVHGMTANAVASLSLDPLLVLVCVEREAVMHKVLSSASGFGLSLLTTRQERLARWFSDSDRPMGLAQFDVTGWRPGGATGAPLLDGSLGWLECAVHDVLDGGDHSIFLGRVLAVERGRPARPLLFYQGEYRRLP